MGETLVDWLAQSVRGHPGSEAVVYKDQRVNYLSLWQDVLKVRYFLHGQGIKKGDRVSLLIENSPQYIASYYGILAAGGVVVALNTAAKANDLLNWIGHSGAKWLFVDSEYPELDTIKNEKGESLQLLLINLSTDIKKNESDVAQWSQLEPVSSAENYSVPLEHSDSAAIIYTSGTTGDPKGVTQSHGNLVHNIRSILDYLHLTHEDRILNVLPFYYSYGNSVLHTHLAVGGTLVLENSLAYPHQVMQKIDKERITGFSGVPSTFALLLSRINFKDYDLSSLRYLTEAGGKMSPAHISRITEEVPHVDFVVMYGQTEATARIAYLPPDKLQEKLSSAGIPIPGVKVEIRDEHGNQLPANKVGEIFVCGENLMKGYWRNQEATEKVIMDGWLKTGDLAYMDDEGYIFIQGRNSEMIKAGANRINPLEIEEVISELESIAEVAVVGVPDEIMGEVIKAVVVPVNGSDIKAREVQAYCRKNLAIYKIPKIVEFIDALPKTASGKLKRYMLSD